MKHQSSGYQDFYKEQRHCLLGIRQLVDLAKADYNNIFPLYYISLPTRFFPELMTYYLILS